MSRVRASEADARQARLLPNPILDVALRFREGGGSPVVEAGLAADLLSLLLRPGRVNAADQRLRAVAAAALVGALDVLADVQQRYAAAQALDALVVVLEERRNLLGRVTQVARAKLGAGEAASLEVTTLEAQRVELETDVAARQLEQRQARLELARLIGQPSDDASWQLDPWQPTPVRAPLDEPAWLARAMAVRPDLQAQEWEVVALRAEAAIAGASLLDGTTAGASAERDDGWRVGPAIAVPLPVFDLGQARRDKALAQLAEGRQKLTRLRRQAVADVRLALAGLSAAREQERKVESELIPLQRRRRQQAEAAFRAGETDLTTFLLAEEGLRMAEVKGIDARRGSTVALVKLQRSAGGFTGPAGSADATRVPAVPATRPVPPAPFD